MEKGAGYECPWHSTDIKSSVVSVSWLKKTQLQSYESSYEEYI
jgi:hypothetical protein